MRLSLTFLTFKLFTMTKYSSSPEDQHFKAIEDQYYQELDTWHCYQVALEQYTAGELECKPEQPFLVML